MSVLSVAALGCGDDVSVPGDGCVGHFCTPEGEPRFTDPEGGNVIFEYIYFDTELQAALGLPTGVTTVQRTMAYFMNAHTPEANPLPQPGECMNLEAMKGWPLYVGPRTDLDVGTLTIKGKNEAGVDTTIDVPKKPAGNDNIGRPHDIFYENISPGAGTYVKPNSRFTMEFGGAGSIPATTFTNLFMPGGSAEGYTLNSPGFEDNGPLVAGTNFPVKWTPGNHSNLPTGYELLGITWLVDSNGSPTHACPTALSDGQFTIPGAAITEYKAIATARGTNPAKMILLRQATVHNLSRLPNNDMNNERRIDVLSVLCWAQLMDVQ
jgi:hypothetical protein